MSSISKLSLALLLLLIVQEESNAARILGIFTIPSTSHFVVCETLMRGLAARGHQVDVISPFPLKKPPPNYRDISIAEWAPASINNLTLKRAQMFTGFNIKVILEMAGNSRCELLDVPAVQNIIKNPPKDPPYDLVITEIFASECYLAFGRHLKVPVVGIVVNKLYDWLIQPIGNPPSTAFVPSIFSIFTQRMTFFERVHNTLYSMFLRMVYWHTVPSQQIYVEKHFGLKLSSTSELYKEVALLLVNTHPSFDFVRPMTSGIVEVGGLHVNEGEEDLSPEMKKWLDESKDGCVYFSFGSMMKIESFPIDTIKAFYETFKRIAPVRVLMKIGNPEELPPGIPKNVMTAPWFPQTRVLKHNNTRAFVTHCGFMSIQEAITYGVPMVGVPIFSDQHLNIRLCKRHNIAVLVDYHKITADSFTDAVKTILQTPTYRENSKRLAKLFLDRPMSALETAIFWVEYVIRNGNVLKSPAEELAWWQVELLDVYAFLLAFLLVIIYVIKRLCVLIFTIIYTRAIEQEERRSTAAASKQKQKKN